MVSPPFFNGHVSPSDHPQIHPAKDLGGHGGAPVGDGRPELQAASNHLRETTKCTMIAGMVGKKMKKSINGWLSDGFDPIKTYLKWMITTQTM